MSEQVLIAGQRSGLGKRLGKGGEGEVFAHNANPGLAIKIYKRELRAQRQSKVAAMIQKGLSKKTELVAFPVDLVTDKRGQFLGFSMRLVKGYRPLHELYSPKDRKRHFPKADYRFLIRTAANIARAVEKVHQANCVVGDFNHSGVLVASDATVALIDADSFQFACDGKLYPCLVGVPDFTPPELHGANLAATPRTKDHDRFGLAVAIFHLLAMGKHPYAGIYTGKDLSMSEAIEQHRFAYSEKRRSQTRTSPPPGSVTLGMFPDQISSAFEAAFGLHASARPSAMEWVEHLTKLEQALSRCSQSKVHFYPTKAAKCIWCELAQKSGVDMFPETLSGNLAGRISGGIDIKAIVAQFNRIALPRPEDYLPTVSANLSPSPALIEARQKALNSKLTGGALLLAAALLIYNLPTLTIIWLGLGAYGLTLFGQGDVATKPLKTEYARADRAARAAEEAYLARIGLTELYAVQEELRVAIKEYQGLDENLTRELRDLKTNREARQRADYLDRFRIRSARINGIGPAKKATLASFGIETAADVSEWAVSRVPGFGEVMTERLVAWRRSKEQRFRYNPAPTSEDAKAEQEVRAKYDKRRLSLEIKIQPAAVTLTTAKVRKLPPDQRLLQALQERAQAKADLEALNLTVPPSPPFNLLPAKQPPPPPTPKSPSFTPRPYYPKSTKPYTGPPNCPKCSSKMVRRLARRGRNAGNHFWGCSRYPSCRGTRNI